MNRIKSIDTVRGIVMVIMALDHVRDLMHIDSITQSPTNLATATPILFFTRWITYLCAPTFVFLAGTSAWLSFEKKNDIKLSRSFLLKRGVYLILLEFVLVNFVMYFDIGFHTILFEVIAAIGFGFIVLGLSLKVPAKALGIAGLLIIFGHGLISYIPFAEGSALKTIVNLFFNLGVFPFSDKVFIMAYPPVPWLGIMLCGFASGQFFSLPAEERKSFFVKIGLGVLALFVILRYINLYGDPVKWSIQKDPVYTILSFINVSKYPPSLSFCLVTLGIMFLMLAGAEGLKNRLTKIVSVYGIVPLFYFAAHFFLIHIIMLGLMFLQGFSWAQLDFASGTFGRPKGIASGVELWVVYLIWIAVVLLLYKPCLWFGKYKTTHQQWWLKYT